MEFTESQTEKIKVKLPNEAIVQIEVASGRGDVVFDTKPFKQVADAIEGIVEAISEPLQKARPDKASVKFGLEIVIEAGNLTAAIVKGSGKANLEIVLEWSKQPSQKVPDEAAKR